MSSQASQPSPLPAFHYRRNKEVDCVFGGPAPLWNYNRHWIRGLANHPLSRRWDMGPSTTTKRTSADLPTSGRVQRAEFETSEVRPSSLIVDREPLGGVHVPRGGWRSLFLRASPASVASGPTRWVPAQLAAFLGQAVIPYCDIGAAAGAGT